MTPTPTIVTTVVAPDGAGWSLITSGGGPAKRLAAERVAIYSDGSLRVLLTVQELHVNPNPSSHAPGFVVTVGYEWRDLVNGRAPFPLSLPMRVVPS